MDNELYDTGLRIRKEVLGDEYVDNALATATDFNRRFQQLTTEFCWGAIWGSDALSRKQRSILNLGMLAAMNRREEFALHFRAALNNGCSLNELRGVLEQITVYCGVPAGLEAFRVARIVLDDIDSTDKPD